MTAPFQMALNRLSTWIHQAWSAQVSPSGRWKIGGSRDNQYAQIPSRTLCGCCRNVVLDSVQLKAALARLQITWDCLDRDVQKSFRELTAAIGRPCDITETFTAPSGIGARVHIANGMLALSGIRDSREQSVADQERQFLGNVSAVRLRMALIGSEGVSYHYRYRPDKVIIQASSVVLQNVLR